MLLSWKCLVDLDCPSQGPSGLRSSHPRVILPTVMWPENSYVARNFLSSRTKSWFLSHEILLCSAASNPILHIHHAFFVLSKIKGDRPVVLIYLVCFILSRLKERDILHILYPACFVSLSLKERGRFHFTFMPNLSRTSWGAHGTWVQALLPTFPPPGTPGELAYDGNKALILSYPILSWRLKEQDILHTLYF